MRHLFFIGSGSSVMSFVVVAGSVYFMHRMAARHLFKSKLLKNRLSGLLAYLLFLAVGSTMALYVSAEFLFPAVPGWPIWLKSLIPTAAGIYIGESLHARHLALTIRLLERIRGNKEGQNIE